MELNGRKGIVALSLLLALALLCACGQLPQPAQTEEPWLDPEGHTVDNETVVSLTGPVTAEELARLDEYPNLERADLSGSTCYAELLAWEQAHPEVELTYTVELPGQTLDNHAERADFSAMSAEELAEALALIAYLPRLAEIKLPELPVQRAEEICAANPERSFDWRFSFLGEAHSSLDTEIDLTALKVSQLDTAAEVLGRMPRLERFILGDENREEPLDWAQIRQLCEAAPQAAPDYSFTLYDVPVNLSDEQLDINHRPVRDEGALLREILPCMPRLTWLCMDSCDVGDEGMAALRDDFPNIEVVWRIWFGGAYSVRTDVEKVLASMPSQGGIVFNDEAAKLKYCTKLKYLDLGHNEAITDLSFLSYMPDLEVLIIAMNPLGDLSPLADCPHLEYLEMFFSDITDISPLANCHELKHLNIGMCDYLTDITPLYGLTQLERVYIGCQTPIPPEQVEELRRLLPDCEINDTDEDTSNREWRFTDRYDDDPAYMACDYYRKGLAPRYALLRQQFGYDYRAYSFAWLDPYNTWQYNR